MSKRRVDEISRRGFLRGAAGFSLAMPALPSLMLFPRGARGQDTVGPPKRFISVFTSNGQRYQNWLPLNSGEPAWRTLDAANQVRDFNLMDLPLDPVTGGISKVLPADLNPVRSKLTLTRGLDLTFKGLSHVPSMMLNGWSENPAGRPTIDQVLANSPKVYASPPPKGRHLHVCLKGQETMVALSVDLAGNHVPAIYNPLTVFNRFFGGGSSGSPAGLKTRRNLVIDLVREEFVTLRSSSRLSSEDKRRLEDHAAKISDLQARVNAVAGMGCTTPPAPASIDEEGLTVDNLAAATKIQIDLIVLAIKCDLTRVITLQLCPGADIRPVSFFPGTNGFQGNHHQLSHMLVGSAPEIEIAAKVNHWYAKQFAYLVNQLNAELEPGTGGTYLDNSLVYWGNEDGCGTGGDVHLPFGMPVILAGSLGGTLSTGKYLDYRTLGERRTYRDSTDTPAYPGVDFIGRPYNQLLVSILDAFGLSPAEYERGAAGYGNYTDESGRQQYARWIDSDAKRRAVLPFLRK